MRGPLHRRGWPCAASGLALVAALSAPGWAAALELGGRVQLEAATLRGAVTDDGRERSGAYRRRAELELRATLLPPLQASATLALDDEDRAVVDEAVLIGWPGGRRGDGAVLRLGRFDPDFGLDPSTSSNWTLALERSPLFDLAPDVASGEDSLGLRAEHAGAGHAASVSLHEGEARDQATLRVVALGTEGAVWQLGGSLARGSGLADDGRLRTRLALRGSTELDGGRRATLARGLSRDERYRRDDTVALEAAWQQGRLLAQAEWLQRRLHGATRGAAPRRAQGHTVTVAWLLHGAPRRHDARRARFGRPGEGGSVEAVLRWDRLQAAGAGGARVATLGLAWTADRVWRVGANHVWARVDEPGAASRRSARGLALRVQATF
jgi:phosphate-selective porin OprO/OprP